MTLESITFYEGELSHRERQECRLLALIETTVKEAEKRKIPHTKLYEQNYAYYLWQSYKAKLYRK